MHDPDTSLSAKIQTAFLAMQREYDTMVAQGWTRETIETELTRRVIVMRQHMSAALPDDEIAYSIKLLMVLCAMRTPADVQRVLPLLHRTTARN
jgi:hypothetical protein